MFTHLNFSKLLFDFVLGRLLQWCHQCSCLRILLPHWPHRHTPLTHKVIYWTLFRTHAHSLTVCLSLSVSLSLHTHTHTHTCMHTHIWCVCRVGTLIIYQLVTSPISVRGFLKVNVLQPLYKRIAQHFVHSACSFASLAKCNHTSEEFSLFDMLLC